jgi:glycosyltransferase involved in cell wall biosynthesis
MKILIDARLFGPKDTGIGRYTQKLVENLVNIDSVNKYIILLRKNDYESLNFPKNWEKVLADFKHYSFEEQLKLPILINKINPDLVHFPHFNVPIFYFKKYIVTIHDLIMHKFAGGTATTRKFPLYQIWRIGYHLVFAKAIYGSVKIIAPSKAVKDEIAKFYKINPKKVEVTYEG